MNRYYPFFIPDPLLKIDHANAKYIPKHSQKVKNKKRKKNRGK